MNSDVKIFKPSDDGTLLLVKVITAKQIYDRKFDERGGLRRAHTQLFREEEKNKKKDT